MINGKRHDHSAGYQLFMLVLCLYALMALGAETMVSISPQTRDVLELADYVVCMLFLADFLVSLMRAPDRLQYFIKWGWLDLLSSIPAIDVARWGRVARVIRIFRVLRGLRASRMLATLILRHRAHSTFLAAGLVALLLIVFCSIAVLHFESAAESNISTADDALWWALTTITTVGYGDRYPVTSEGRVVAAILMGSGVGLFGIFSGFLAAWFMGSESNADNSDLRAEIKMLRLELAALRRHPADCEETALQEEKR